MSSKSQEVEALVGQKYRHGFITDIESDSLPPGLDEGVVLELCVAEGIAWVPYFPLGGANFGLPKVTDEPAVVAAARSLGSTPAQVGLAWLLHHTPNTLLIPGTADVGHLEANVAAGALVLDDATLAALDAVPSRSVDVVLG